MRAISKASLDEVLRGMNINDISKATIRQCVNTAQELERVSGESFIHLEFGVPGIKASQFGVDMQKLALDEELQPSIRLLPVFRNSSGTLLLSSKLLLGSIYSLTVSCLL